MTRLGPTSTFTWKYGDAGAAAMTTTAPGKASTPVLNEAPGTGIAGTEIQVPRS
jgi:hypothetical protein